MRTVIADARRLRAARTPAEQALWGELRNRKLRVKFRRQHPFDCYLVDFYCRDAALVIEVDGDVHAGPDAAARDSHRTEVLQRHGLCVLRFTNREVLGEMEAVLERIRAVLEQRLDRNGLAVA